MIENASSLVLRPLDEGKSIVLCIIAGAVSIPDDIIQGEAKYEVECSVEVKSKSTKPFADAY